MILNKDIHPERDIYALGAFVINALDKNSSNNNVLQIYQRTKQQTDISMNSLILTLDWLFLLGAVKYKNGVIEYVSKKTYN